MTDEVESIRIQLLEIEDMDEDELTNEIMDNYNNLETRLWELTGGFEAEDFEAIEFREMPQLSARDVELAKLIAIYYQEMGELFEAGELTKAIEKEFDEAIENIFNQMSPEAQNPWGAETFEAEEMMIPRWTPEGVIMTPVSDAYGAFYGADGRPIMLISKVSRESMTDEDWEEAKKEIEESQNSTFKIGIPEYFRAERNAEEILLCKKEDCDNERDMSVSWMGMCEPCYEVHQESCKGCRDFERSKRENPNPPTDNWKKYNSECTDKDAETLTPQKDTGTWTPATPLPHQVSDFSIYGRGTIGTDKPSKPISPKKFPSATNEQIMKEFLEAREKDFQRNWETLDKNPETNPYGRGPVSDDHTMKVIKKYGEKAVQDALKPPSATIPSWAKPLATVIGFGLGFLGIRELKKRV